MNFESQASRSAQPIGGFVDISELLLEQPGTLISGQISNIEKASTTLYPDTLSDAATHAS
jgi:hypothetical protein